MRAVYQDLLGRPPLEEERGRWRGAGVRTWLDEALGSEALWSHWLEEQLYYFLLIDNFRPEGERIESAPADLAAGRRDVQQVIHHIALSSSFDQRNPGADTFVTVVMEQLGGMTVQKNARELDIGKRIYDGAKGNFLGKAGSNQADVVRITVEHRRFAEHFLEREYRRLLRCDPPRGRAWSQQVLAFQRDAREFKQILRAWILSEEYEARLREPVLQPNRLFVSSLFVDLIDRSPNPDEHRRMRNALDGLSDAGPLRSVIARLIIDSGAASIPPREMIVNPDDWIRELFEKLLARAPSEAELQTFVAAFDDPACRPETIVYALVSHPEYHHY
jgi:hypothetical protein